MPKKLPTITLAKSEKNCTLAQLRAGSAKTSTTAPVSIKLGVFSLNAPKGKY